MYRNFIRTTTMALGTLLVSSTLVLAAGVSGNAAEAQQAQVAPQRVPSRVTDKQTLQAKAAQGLQTFPKENDIRRLTPADADYVRKARRVLEDVAAHAGQWSDKELKQRLQQAQRQLESYAGTKAPQEEGVQARVKSCVQGCHERGLQCNRGCAEEPEAFCHWDCFVEETLCKVGCDLLALFPEGIKTK